MGGVAVEGEGPACACVVRGGASGGGLVDGALVLAEGAVWSGSGWGRFPIAKDILEIALKVGVGEGQAEATAAVFKIGELGVAESIDLKHSNIVMRVRG